MTDRHRVVIIGGGFAGLQAARALAKAPVAVTLIDRRNFHLFQPLLYQVATGGLSPANIASPLREILKRQKNAEVVLGDVVDIDAAGRRVTLADGAIDYDTLIVAAGMRNHYFEKAQWEPLAPGLKTVEDATSIRRRILLAFEAAERASDPEKVRALLTFVVVGGGPTGVELAGALAEIARDTLRHEFRHIDPTDAKILLIELGERILPSYTPELSQRTVEGLARLGVSVRTGCRLIDIQPDSVSLEAEGRQETLAARTVLWAAGVRGSPLGEIVVRGTGAALDRAGRVVVGPDLGVAGHPEIFVIGDLASFSHQTGEPLPGVAPVAMQEGRYVASLVAKRLRGETLPAFRYKDPGMMTTIGRSNAVVQLKRYRSSGFFAWLLWLFVHVTRIVELENRVLVMMQWAWNYFTFNRSARLITGESELSH